ncbi:hypothetical protein F4604DRAFT_1678100 [Suillus subluteus]|nr:hypothetical protein F4604DRAFT_1678100 [Suillus subluteus]
MEVWAGSQFPIKTLRPSLHPLLHHILPITSSFTFSEVVNPNVDKLQCAFADLRLKLGHLVTAIPEDRLELIQRKEEWLRDWNKLVELSNNAMNCKTYNMNLPLSSDEVALGHKAEEAQKFFTGQVHTYKLEVQRLVDEQAALEREQSKERELESEKGKEKSRETDEAMDEVDGDADAEGESDEDEVDVHPPLVAKQAVTVGVMTGRRKALKTPCPVAPVVHPNPCARCVRAKKPCVSKPGNSCEICKDARKKFAKERAAARAVAAKAVVKAPSAPCSQFLCGAGVSLSGIPGKLLKMRLPAELEEEERRRSR